MGGAVASDLTCLQSRAADLQALIDAGRGDVPLIHLSSRQVKSLDNALPSTRAGTVGQTTAGRCGRRSWIPETATELSAAAWIIGQRNRAGLVLDWT